MSEPSATRPALLLWIACLSTAVLVSLLLHVLVGSTPAADSGRAASVPEGPDPRIANLEARILELEAQVNRLQIEKARAEREPVSAPGEDPPEAATLAEMNQRLQRLEARRNDREQQVLAQVYEEERSAQQQQRAKRDAAHATILDPETSDSAKAHAWLELASLESEPWTDEIIAIMTGIGANSTDDRAREVVWIGADTRHRSPMLAQPLVWALSDPIANVREEAADALGHYVDVPGVRDALLWTSENDSSDTVRREAQRVLRSQ